MVFDPAAPPADRAGFMEWYQAQTEWSEDHDYNDPAVCGPVLQAWFTEMRQCFPAMNGPYAVHDFDNPRVSDYSVGRTIIYASFRWSEAEAAYTAMFDLAKKHGVGFFDVSANDGQVWVPVEGIYHCIHGTSEGEPAVHIYSVSIVKKEDS